MNNIPSKSTTYEVSAKFVFRLGRHHFAHLRAVAEGLDLADCAERYLGIEHGNQAKAANQQTVDAVRSVAIRRGEPAWRLIGLAVRVKTDANKPTLEEFVAMKDLDDWPENEVLLTYLETYPTDARADKRRRLRERLLDLLRRLEVLEAEQPLPSDMVSGWFDDVTARKLISAGMVTLGELRTKVTIGGRWYRTMPAVGRAKAQRIARHLSTLLPADERLKIPAFELPSSATQLATFVAPSNQSLVIELPANQGGPASTIELPMLAANTDMDAVQAWIRARSGSPVTTRTYLREATRLLLWLQYERADAKLKHMRIDDCMDYMAFLQNIPPHWISRVHAKPGQPGWAPFRGPLSHDSQKQAIILIASLFAWLHSAQYISGNPWVLVNKKTGDDSDRNILDTKALSEGASSEILRFIDSQPPSPARSRMRFILIFMSSVGLRSAELLKAELGHIQNSPEGWVMQVDGKGSKKRVAAIPGQAISAMQAYLAERGIASMDAVSPDTPLLASTKDPLAPIGYQALYEHVKGWLRKAISASSLPSREQQKLQGASTHWLRHTFGTRAIAKDVPLDVIQAQMGHASIQTTTAIYGKAPIKRRVDKLEEAFS